jgi:hypothetical protein
MSISTTPREEEQAARKRERDNAKRDAARDAKADKERRSKLANIIRDELARERAKQCRCGITTRTTWAEIRALGEGCTGDRWICPVLDTVRRRMGH